MRPGVVLVVIAPGHVWSDWPIAPPRNVMLSERQDMPHTARQNFWL